MTALNTPWTMRLSAVSWPVIMLPTGMPQPQASTAAAPMIKNARDAALEADRGHAWADPLPICVRAGRPKQVLDRAPGHRGGERQGDDDQHQPEARHGAQHPEHPQQHNADRQQRVTRAPTEVVLHG